MAHVAFKSVLRLITSGSFARLLTAAGTRNSTSVPEGSEIHDCGSGRAQTTRGSRQIPCAGSRASVGTRGGSLLTNRRLLQLNGTAGLRADARLKTPMSQPGDDPLPGIFVFVRGRIPPFVQEPDEEGWPEANQNSNWHGQNAPKLIHSPARMLRRNDKAKFFPPGTATARTDALRHRLVVCTESRTLLITTEGSKPGCSLGGVFSWRKLRRRSSACSERAPACQVFV
jgi:hypothetical protein